MLGMGWIMTIIVGGIAGWIAEKLMKADHGLLTNILLGIAGAVVLNFVLGLVGFSFVDTIWQQLIVAVAGACALIYGYRMIRS